MHMRIKCKHAYLMFTYSMHAQHNPCVSVWQNDLLSIDNLRLSWSWVLGSASSPTLQFFIIWLYVIKLSHMHKWFCTPRPRYHHHHHRSMKVVIKIGAEQFYYNSFMLSVSYMYKIYVYMWRKIDGHILWWHTHAHWCDNLLI